MVATLRPHQDRLDQPYQTPSTSHASASSHAITHPEPGTVPPTDAEPFPLSAQLEARYGEREAELVRLTQLRARESALRKHLKKLLRRAEALRRDLEQAGRYEPYARYGELLKANLGSIKKGLTAISVVDYYDDGCLN